MELYNIHLLLFVVCKTQASKTCPLSSNFRKTKNIRKKQKKLWVIRSHVDHVFSKAWSRIQAINKELNCELKKLEFPIRMFLVMWYTAHWKNCKSFKCRATIYTMQSTEIGVLKNIFYNKEDTNTWGKNYLKVFKLDSNFLQQCSSSLDFLGIHFLEVPPQHLNSVKIWTLAGK